MTKLGMEAKAKVVAAIAAYNKAVNDKNLEAINKAESAVKDAEKEYAQQSQLDTFGECRDAENPILAGIKRGWFPVLRHKINRDGDVILGMELVEDAEKQIDLAALFKFFQKDTLWKYKVEKMGELLCIRIHDDLGHSGKEVAQKVATTYRMSDKARELDMGGTPVSNSQMTKLLQTVIDSILFVDDGNGKNVYKINNFDVKYLLYSYTRRGSQKLTLKVANTSTVTRLVAEVLYRLTNDLVYSVDYKMVKPDGEKAAKKAKKPEVAPAEAATETIVVTKEQPAEETAA